MKPPNTSEARLFRGACGHSWVAGPEGATTCIYCGDDSEPANTAPLHTQMADTSAWGNGTVVWAQDAAS